MKIVEGKVGKSREVERIILDNKDKKILVVNTVCPGIFGNIDNVHEVSYSSNDELWTDLIDDKVYADFIEFVKDGGYNIIIFEVNDKQALYDNYGCIEDKLGIKLIVTIQNNDLEFIRVTEG